MSSDSKRPWWLPDFDPWPSPPDDNPFARALAAPPAPPQNRLGDLVNALYPSASPFGSLDPRQPSLGDLLNALDPSASAAGRPVNALAPQSRLGDLSALNPSSSPFRSLADFSRLDPSPPAGGGLFSALATPPARSPFDFPAPLQPRIPTSPAVEPKKRRAFFSFHYEDVMRSAVVCKAWKFTNPANNSFTDSSLWEDRKLESPETIKRLIREGVWYTSVVCVLAGSDTWLRRWVRYEIARAVIDELGLLTVHLNSIKHHKTLTPHTRGLNPLAYMAVGKVQESVYDPARYYLFERNLNQRTWQFEWVRYEDHTHPVNLPRWLADPDPGFVTPLASYADEYDFMAQDGHKNIGTWLDRAARRAGR